MHFLVINGPNLDLLGKREPEVYGSTTLPELEGQIAEWADGMGVEVDIEQSNSESRILELLHGFDGDGIVINPGALTHTSRTLADAIAGVGIPAVEVHISNVKAREPWRARSVLADVCVRSIFGRGVGGYRSAMRHLVNRASVPFETIRYGPHPDNVGDLRRGTGDLIILAHGGLWKEVFERDLTESLAVDLADRGYSTWNLEYRRMGNGGGWPASGHDVLTALETIPQLATEHERVVLLGHSVGSQLLMWAAPRSSAAPALHVALAPLIDLGETVRSGDVGAAECGAMLDQGAPSGLDPAGVETVLVHGDDDQIVPVERSVVFAERHGLELHSTGCEHFSLLDPSRPEWDWVLQRIAAEEAPAG